MDKYIPPYDITEEMLELTSEIMELLGELKIIDVETLTPIESAKILYDLVQKAKD